jgi:nicotinamidase-related amidase
MKSDISDEAAEYADEAPAWIHSWFEGLTTAKFADLVPDPERAALFCTDMLVGFCSRGPLASERVGALANPVRDLFELSHRNGVRKFVLTHDTHDADTPEFEAWPPHCIRGTEEAELIPELASLSFANLFTIFEKNSLSPAFGTGFDAWLDANQDLETALVAGNCTDLCVYTLAMHLRLRANALNRTPFRVIVPANCVDTYDLPPVAARSTGAFAHPGEFFHRVFLYHLALNGIAVVKAIS